MRLIAGSPADYLGADDVIDAMDEDVAGLAAALRGGFTADVDFARSAYEWVRDEVGHSVDVADPRISVTASDALRNRVGLCHAKSHLLVALLRAQGIPAGLCYQRLADGTGGFQLHGWVAVRLDGAWHRVDPRGNRDERGHGEGIDARFSLDREQLAWIVDAAAGEVDYPDVRAHPHPGVIAALRSSENVLTVRLPAEG